MVAIFGALAADQAVKRLLLSGAVDLNGTMLIPGVANVTFAWNRGVSFNLLWSNSDLGSLLLFAGAACIVAALLVWAFRARRVRVASSDRFDNWGCLGNLVDRYLYGAVFDFLVMRLGEITLFVCNLADICFWHKADKLTTPGDVRFGGKADIGLTPRNVRFRR